MAYGTVYALHDSTGLRYIGQTTLPLAKRLSGHLHKRTCDHRGRWISKLASLGLQPTITALATAQNRPQLDALEVAMIAAARVSGCDLVNTENGGNSVGKHSAATRAKIGASSSIANKGKKVPAEVVAKRVASRSGYRHTPETRDKIRASLAGHTVSESARKKISSAFKGKKLPPETIAKISSGLVGRPVSNVTRAKASASGKAAWVRRRATSLLSK